MIGRILTIAAIGAGLSGCATIGLGSDNDFDAMEGEWIVDLTPSPDAEIYRQSLRLDIDRDGRVTGEFYDSPIIAGRAGEGQGRICAAFRTSDNSGPYHHSACVEDGDLIGQTWSEGREFTMPWTATRD